MYLKEMSCEDAHWMYLASYWGQWQGPEQCFSTFVRPRPRKFFFYKTRARSQQICS